MSEEYIRGYVRVSLENDSLKRANASLVHALKHMEGWVKHWQDDAACDLKPTPESLATAAAQIAFTLSSPRVSPREPA